VLRELISLYLIGDTRTCARLGLLLPDLKSIFIPILFPSSLINNLCPALTHPYLSSTHKAVVFPHARPTLSPSPTLAQVPHRLHRYAWYMALREVVRSGWQRTAALFFLSDELRLHRSALRLHQSVWQRCSVIRVPLFFLSFCFTFVR
jgi:hypothetical protein